MVGRRSWLSAQPASVMVREWPRWISDSSHARYGASS